MRSLFSFIALEPEEKLYNVILDVKKAVFEILGPQNYLKDRPHLTLQVGSFADMKNIEQILHKVSQTAALGSIYLKGWHVFQNDPLTGGHTVVTNILDEYKIKLIEIQSIVLQATRPLLNIEACLKRYSSSWEKLTPLQRASTEAWGFPFTGNDWHPHVTVASISQDHWSLVWDTLQKFSPHGSFTFPKMCLYRIDQNQVSEKIAEFSLAVL